jgi:hypothetical protein
MTKKHFEWAARYIAVNGGPEKQPEAFEAFVDLFTHFNPRFDEARFKAACEKEAK